MGHEQGPNRCNKCRLTVTIVDRQKDDRHCAAADVHPFQPHAVSDRKQVDVMDSNCTWLNLVARLICDWPVWSFVAYQRDFDAHEQSTRIGLKWIADRIRVRIRVQIRIRRKYNSCEQLSNKE